MLRLPGRQHSHSSLPVEGKERLKNRREFTLPCGALLAFPRQLSARTAGLPILSTGRSNASTHPAPGGPPEFELGVWEGGWLIP